MYLKPTIEILLWYLDLYKISMDSEGRVLRFKISHWLQWEKLEKNRFSSELINGNVNMAWIISLIHRFQLAQMGSESWKLHSCEGKISILKNTELKYTF